MPPSTWIRFLVLGLAALGLMLVLGGLTQSTYTAYQLLASPWPGQNVDLSTRLSYWLKPEKLWNGGGAMLLTGLAITVSGALLQLLQTAAESLSRLADDPERQPTPSPRAHPR